MMLVIGSIVHAANASCSGADGLEYVDSPKAATADG